MSTIPQRLREIAVRIGTLDMAAYVQLRAIAAELEESARALLSALQEDAEHAARYRWLREQHESSDSSESFCVFAPVPSHNLEPVGIMPGELDAIIRSAMSLGTSGNKVKTDKTDEVIDVVMEYMPGLIDTVAMSVNAGYIRGNGPGVVSMVKSIEHAIRMTLEEPLPWSVASAAIAKETK